MVIVPTRFHETAAQKAARRKHGRRALAALLEAARRMERARLPLVTVTGAIGEAWAVAELAMQPTDNAAAAYDGWLPDGRTVDVKCRYMPKGGSTVLLNPEKTASIDLLVAIQITAEKQLHLCYLGPYAAAVNAGRKRSNGIVSARWADLQALCP